MTEAGEKWALSKEVPKKDAEDFEIRHILEDAEFWLRDFCEEVERRAKEFYPENDEVWPMALLETFTKLKRELLGE